jgi:4-amino-4-deoxy-L-arabinose transferase-like glycosyltransferase
MNIRSIRFISILVLGLLAATGIFLVLRATPEGLGLSDDSIGYIAGARSMLAGNGYREAWLASNGPVTHYPPAFSSALALAGLFGLDPLRGVRFLNASLFGLNLALLGILGWRMMKSLTAGLILAALFLVNDSLLRVHTAAMSEPLFIFLSLLAFWMFDLYFERDAHWLWLVMCGIFVGLAYLTRYAGLALLATFGLALIILHDNWRKRLTSVGILTASVLPWMAGWAIRNETLGGSATNRALVWHPITASNFDTALYNVSTFLMPVEAWRRELFKFPALFVAAVIIILGAILIWLLVKTRKYLSHPVAPDRSTGATASEPGGKANWAREIVPFTSGLYVFGYLASILASMSFFDASTKFKPRILAPVYVSLLILLVVFGLWLWRKRRELVIVLVLLIFGLSAAGQYTAVKELAKGGQGYASFQWYDSKTMAFLRTLPPQELIYTNQPTAVYLYTGRGAYVLPDRFDPVTAEQRPGFDRGVQEMQAQIKAGRAVLALFSGDNPPASDAALMSSGLYLAQKSAGDEVYTAAP